MCPGRGAAPPGPAPASVPGPAWASRPWARAPAWPAGRRRREQMARPLLVPGGAACGAGVHPRGSAPPPTLAPLLIRRFGGTLCGRSGTGWGLGRLHTRRGARPHRLALPQGFDRSGYAHGVVRDLQRGLGSILGPAGVGATALGLSGHLRKSWEGRKPGCACWLESASLRGPPGEEWEDCSCLLAGDQVWVPGGGWPRPSFHPSQVFVPERLDPAKGF